MIDHDVMTGSDSYPMGGDPPEIMIIDRIGKSNDNHWVVIEAAEKDRETN